MFWLVFKVSSEHSFAQDFGNPQFFLLIFKIYVLPSCWKHNKNIIKPIHGIYVCESQIKGLISCQTVCATLPLSLIVPLTTSSYPAAASRQKEGIRWGASLISHVHGDWLKQALPGSKTPSSQTVESYISFRSWGRGFHVAVHTLFIFLLFWGL